MSELYESIPPERRDAYLANVEQAFGEATGEAVDQVVGDMGRLAAQDAEAITEDPYPLSEADERFLMVHDIASRRARGEHLERADLSGASFGEMFKAAIEANKSRTNQPQTPNNLNEEFGQAYLAAKESKQENSDTDPNQS